MITSVYSLLLFLLLTPIFTVLLKTLPLFKKSNLALPLIISLVLASILVVSNPFFNIFFLDILYVFVWIFVLILAFIFLKSLRSQRKGR